MAPGTSCMALAALLVLAGAFSAAATSYTVGDKSGWTIGVDYNTWAGSKSFKVGDNLVFNYASGQHTVVEVSAADYLACTAANPLGSDSSGATTVALKTPGKHYFICSIAGHCAGGMKLEVSASGSGSGSSSPSSPTPTTPTPSTPTTTPTPTTPYTTPTPTTTTPYTTPTPTTTTPYTTPTPTTTTPYTTPTSPACSGTTPVTPGTTPFMSYNPNNGAAGLAPVALASFGLVCVAIVQLGLL